MTCNNYSNTAASIAATHMNRAHPYFPAGTFYLFYTGINAIRYMQQINIKISLFELPALFYILLQ